MAQRRHASKDEILLVPFLDILCSLIGILVLIIVVLSVAQSQQTEGRTPQEIAAAQEYKELQKKRKEQTATDAQLKEKIAALEKLKQEADEKEQKLARLRKLLATTADVKKMNQELSQNMLKELDNLLVEMDGYTKQQTELKKEIAALMVEIAKRQPPKDKPLPPVIVQPGGSGLAKGSKVFFVEVSGGRLTIFWDQKQKTFVSATDEVIAADPAYNHLLKEALKVPQAKIIFLLRDDGMAAYNRAAGWAQATYGYRVDQVGKLPIPGRGEVDLQMFRDFLGTMPPPPEAKLVPPPATPQKI